MSRAILKERWGHKPSGFIFSFRFWIYNVSHAFSAASGGVVVGTGTLDSRSFGGVSVVADDVGGAIATSSMCRR